MDKAKWGTAHPAELRTYLGLSLSSCFFLARVGKERAIEQQTLVVEFFKLHTESQALLAKNIVSAL